MGYINRTNKLAIYTTKDMERGGWVQVDVVTAVDPAELLGVLNDPDVTGAWQEGDRLHLYWPAARWEGDALRRVRQALAQLGGSPDEGAVLVRDLADQDWNEVWARQVEPIRIGRLVVRPSWKAVDLHPGDIELVIDPKQAFGTGHHATTQMLLERLQRVVTPQDLVLDVGTGSGILAMATLRLGAARARGVDHDAVAVDCAREYAAVNGFDDRLTLEVASAEAGGIVDPFVPTLVVANLDRQILLAAVKPLARYVSDGARLLLSGLLVEQRAEIEQAYAAHGAYVVGSQERDGWTALELGAVESCEGV